MERKTLHWAVHICENEACYAISWISGLCAQNKQQKKEWMKSWGLFVSNFYKFAQNSRSFLRHEQSQSGKIWWSFELKLSFTIVCVLSSCKPPPKKSKFDLFMKKGREKWWKISRRKRSFSIRQIPPEAHHVQCLPLYISKANSKIDKLFNWASMMKHFNVHFGPHDADFQK